MELAPGAEIDRYAVEALLGEGGMAVVYRVRHRTLGSLHALKVLTVTNPKLRDRLVREGRVQATLQHPNVVGVTDIIDVRGSPGLIMQFVDGPSLEAWLEQGLPELSEAERIFLGILDAVEAAHALGVVHRDLKPANVLLARTSAGLVPRVADFGIARALSEGEFMRATRTGAAMGTPSFMAPEQIRDARNVDHRADIFSLGCVLYEMVTGTPAFRGESVLDLFEAISAGRFLPPEEVVPSLPPALCTAIRGALVADRDRRIPDCGTLRAVIRGDRGWEVAQEAVVPATTPLPIQTPPRPKVASSVTMSLDDALADDPEPAKPIWRTGLFRIAAMVSLLGLFAAVYGWRALSGDAPPPPSVEPVEIAPPAAPTSDVVAGADGVIADPGLNTTTGKIQEAGLDQVDPGAVPSGTAAAGTAGTGSTGTTLPPPPNGGGGGKGGTSSGGVTKPKGATVTADAQGIRLVGSSGKVFPMGAVPPGLYSIEWVQNGVPGGAGAIEVREGEQVALRCSPDFFSCERAN